MTSSQSTVITEKQWEHLLSSLSPNKIVALEKTIKSYQNKYQPELKNNNNKENNIEEMEDDIEEIVIKSEPTLSTKSSLNNHRTKNRGLTYENGRRNLKAERVSSEEMDRRAKRRERNRIAAAKCRERRQLQLDELQQEVEVLRSAEITLQSTLEKLEAEEIELRTKLSSHNCVISEASNGEISIIIPTVFHDDIDKQKYLPQNNNNHNYPPRNKIVYDQMGVSNHSICRPKSLPVPCQNCTSVPTDPFFDKTPSLDRLVARDDSLTPLLSPDTYSLLKGHLKSENTPTTPNKPVYNKPPVIISIKSESTDNVAFSWNNSIVDQLSMSCSDGPGAQFLSTPVVDMPYYQHESYSSQLNSVNNNSINHQINRPNNHSLHSMDWH